MTAAPATGTALVHFIPPITDTVGLGKAMIALNAQQRAFVLAFVETGGQDATRAALIAGYCPDNPQARRVTAHRLMHTAKVLAAIKEVADARVRSGALLGAERILQIAQDPTHKDSFKASVELMNRAGLLVVQQKEVIHRNEDDADRVQRIVNMAKQLGLDPKELLGSAGVVVDAEFKVVHDGRSKTAAVTQEVEDELVDVDPGEAGEWTIYPDEEDEDELADAD